MKLPPSSPEWLGYTSAALIGVPRLLLLLTAQVGPVHLFLPLAMTAVTWALSRYPLPAIVCGSVLFSRYLLLAPFSSSLPARVIPPSSPSMRIVAAIGAMVFIAALVAALMRLPKRSSTSTIV